MERLRLSGRLTSRVGQPLTLCAANERLWQVMAALLDGFLKCDRPASFMRQLDDEFAHDCLEFDP